MNPIPRVRPSRRNRLVRKNGHPSSEPTASTRRLVAPGYEPRRLGGWQAKSVVAVTRSTGLLQMLQICNRGLWINCSTFAIGRPPNNESSIAQETGAEGHGGGLCKGTSQSLASSGKKCCAHVCVNRIKVQKPICSLALASASRSMYADTSKPTTRLSQLC
jgi:hypothetical protein